VQIGGIGGAVLFLAAALIPVSGKMPIVGTPAWTLFGLVSAAAAAFGAVTARPGAPAGSRLVGQVGAGGMALFWVLIGVPAVPNTSSLLITLGAAVSGAAVWLSTRENP
jgi:hypothetical protein